MSKLVDASSLLNIPVPLVALEKKEYREHLSDLSGEIFPRSIHRLAVCLVIRHQDGIISRETIIKLSGASGSAMTRESIFLERCHLVSIVKPEHKKFYERCTSNFWKWLDEILNLFAPWPFER